MFLFFCFFPRWLVVARILTTPPAGLEKNNFVVSYYFIMYIYTFHFYLLGSQFFTSSASISFCFTPTNTWGLAGYLPLDCDVLPWIKVWVLTGGCWAFMQQSVRQQRNLLGTCQRVKYSCDNKVFVCKRLSNPKSFDHVQPNSGCWQLHPVPFVLAAPTRATDMTRTGKTFTYYPSDSLCHRLWQRSRCYRAPRWVPLFLPGAINVTATLAPKWLPPRDGGVTSPWQPGPALRGSSACATKPGVRVQPTSWPPIGIDPL